MIMGRMASVAGLVSATVALLACTVTPVGAQCTGGIDGVPGNGTDVCCTVGCPSCGGSGCRPPAASGLTSDDCCTSNIITSGVFCSVSGVAPCITTTESAPADSVCINGQTGVQDPNTDVCCPLECGTNCGGEGCGSLAQVPASSCCASLIFDSGAICSDTVLPPCTVVATAGDNSTTCSNGLAGIEDEVNLICCDAACGQCGGAGCGDVAGLTGASCCSAEISAAGQLCSVTGAAPCVVDPPDFAASTCPNGIAGVQDDSVCCAEACNGQCGGEGCGTIVGTAGASDCCSATILATGVPCDEGVEAPCVMLPGTFTNAPAAAPTIPPLPGTTPGSSAAPTAGSRDFDFTSAPTAVGGGGTTTTSTAPTMAGMTSAPTAAADAGGAAATTAGATSAPTAVAGGDAAPATEEGVTTAPTAAGSSAEGETIAPTTADGERGGVAGESPAPAAGAAGDETFAPADTNKDGVVNGNDGEDTNGDGVIDENDGVDTNGDGVIDENDGVDTNGDGVIDENDGVDTNGDGVIDENDGAAAAPGETPAPAEATDTEASGNGALSTVKLPAGSVYAGVVGVAAVVGGMFVL